MEVLSFGDEDAGMVWGKVTVATVQHLVELGPMEGVLGQGNYGVIVLIDDPLINTMLLFFPTFTRLDNVMQQMCDICRALYNGSYRKNAKINHD